MRKCALPSRLRSRVVPPADRALCRHRARAPGRAPSRTSIGDRCSRSRAGRVARDVLAKDLEHRALEPVVAEIDSLALASLQESARAHVERLLEQRHPRLVPESVLQEDGGIHGHRQHRPRDRLRSVVEPRELLGAGLEVHLEARGARFEHHVLVEDLQLVQTLDERVEITAGSSRITCSGWRCAAPCPGGGGMPATGGPRAGFARHGPRTAGELVDSRSSCEAHRREILRREIRLELRELGCIPAARALQGCTGAGSGPSTRHLLLRTDPDSDSMIRVIAEGTHVLEQGENCRALPPDAGRCVRPWARSRYGSASLHQHQGFLRASSSWTVRGAEGGRAISRSATCVASQRPLARSAATCARSHSRPGRALRSGGSVRISTS